VDTLHNNEDHEETKVVNNYLDELYTDIVQVGEYTFEEMQNMMNKNENGWFFMNNKELNDQDAKNISIILKEDTNIQELYLFQNEISDTGLEYLLESLKDNQTLKRLNITHNKIQGQDIMKTKFVNNTLNYLYLNSNNISDSTAINQYLQNFRGLIYVELNHNPINFQNAKMIVQDTNLSVKGKYILKLRFVTELSNIETRELGIIWKLKLYDMYVTNPKSLDGKKFEFEVGNNSIYRMISMTNGEVEDNVNGISPLADFAETMRPIKEKRQKKESKNAAFTIKYPIKHKVT
jgi:hypothetical protein